MSKGKELEFCESCQGEGYIVELCPIRECCGNYTQHGECCGDPILVAGQYPYQCPNCYGSGFSKPIDIEVQNEQG